jgi:hypothetical protein
MVDSKLIDLIPYATCIAIAVVIAAQLKDDPIVEHVRVVQNGVPTDTDEWKTVVKQPPPPSLSDRIIYASAISVILCLACYVLPKTWGYCLKRIREGNKPRQQRG